MKVTNIILTFGLMLASASHAKKLSISEIVSIEMTNRTVIHNNEIPVSLIDKEGNLKEDQNILNVEISNGEMINLENVMKKISGGQDGGHG